MNRFKVAYNITNRNGKRKTQSRNVEADVTKLDKQGLGTLADVLTLSHGLRQDENKSTEIPDPNVEITAARGLSVPVVDQVYPAQQSLATKVGTEELKMNRKSIEQEQAASEATEKATSSKKDKIK